MDFEEEKKRLVIIIMMLLRIFYINHKNLHNSEHIDFVNFFFIIIIVILITEYVCRHDTTNSFKTFFCMSKKIFAYNL